MSSLPVHARHVSERWYAAVERDDHAVHVDEFKGDGAAFRFGQRLTVVDRFVWATGLSPEGAAPWAFRPL